ncbi:L-asparagine oxygenase [Streptacidiphilus sp. MAP12-33]|uniref:TauD/TfdA family dioxygenase n=1 Tax=Streptacidiphilus sp. MAP12-33 TaxID=3156266 RepID=UPI0035167CF2
MSQTQALAHLYELELTDAEQAQVLHAAERLARAEPGVIDDPVWVEAVLDAGAVLPARLLRTLRRFRHDPGPNGALLLRNLPVVGAVPLPVTPCRPGSVERTPSVAAGVLAAVMAQLGEIIAFRAEKTGALVQNVVPVPGSEASQSNAGSVLLELHTENAFHPNRPDYVGLVCLREDPTGDARLCTSSIRQALPLLPPETVGVLWEPRFLTEAPPSFGSPDGVAPAHALLRGAPEDPDVLVDFAATHPLDEGAERAMAELREAFVETMDMLALRPGELAVVDNRMAVHGRTSFVPSYDGNDRWLQRVYAHLDGRRTRPDRTGGGPVLD